MPQQRGLPDAGLPGTTNAAPALAWWPGACWCSPSQRPGVAWLADLALAAFGGSFVALSGVLIAWGGRLRPDGAAVTVTPVGPGLPQP